MPLTVLATSSLAKVTNKDTLYVHVEVKLWLMNVDCSTSLAPSYHIQEV